MRRDFCQLMIIWIICNKLRLIEPGAYDAHFDKYTTGP